MVSRAQSHGLQSTKPWSPEHKAMVSRAQSHSLQSTKPWSPEHKALPCDYSLSLVSVVTRAFSTFGNDGSLGSYSSWLGSEPTTTSTQPSPTDTYYMNIECIQ